MGNHKITIICYANDAILIADSEDNLQRQWWFTVRKPYGHTLWTYPINVPYALVSCERTLPEGRWDERTKGWTRNIVEMQVQLQYPFQCNGLLGMLLSTIAYVHVKLIIKMFIQAVRSLMT
ncbi:hypothetical protein M0802_004652 [Mischocyttarus mexicanus]|nr:hypothetical protein M0802_004652 [Mischocyttarus mexicanus]